MRENALPCAQAAALQQPLPRRETRYRQACAHREVDIAGQRSQIARLDGHVLRKGTIAIPIREPENPLSHRQTRRAISESGDHSGQLVAGDRWRSIAIATIAPGRRPSQLRRNEPRRMNLNDDIIDCRVRLGPVRQRHPGGACSLVCDHDCSHKSLPSSLVGLDRIRPRPLTSV